MSKQVSQKQTEILKFSHIVIPKLLQKLIILFQDQHGKLTWWQVQSQHRSCTVNMVMYF